MVYYLKKNEYGCRLNNFVGLACALAYCGDNGVMSYGDMHGRDKWPKLHKCWSDIIENLPLDDRFRKLFSLFGMYFCFIFRNISYVLI